MGAVRWDVFLPVLGMSSLLLIVLLLITWLVGRAQRRHAVMDCAWGIGFVLVAGAGVLVTSGLGEPLPDPVRRWLVLALTGVWGLRLAVHLARRLRGSGEDPRYADLLGPPDTPGRDALALRRVYLPQGAFLLVVSLVLQVGVLTTTPTNLLTWAGVAIWAIGFSFETVGDAQLAAHRADPARRGTVLDSGVWRFTRHPNYFGDAALWWGLWLVTASAGVVPALVTIVGPVLMTWTLTSKTGTPLTEARMSGRPGYAEYVTRTSAFLPWPPRRV